MLNIFIIFYFLKIIFCKGLEQWNYTYTEIYNYFNVDSTSFASVTSKNLHQFITYDQFTYNNIWYLKGSIFWNLNPTFTLSPKAMSFYNSYIFLIIENQNFYIIINTKNYSIHENSFNETNIKRLNGMEFYKSNFLLISLIGTNKIYYYYLNDSYSELKIIYESDHKIISFYGESEKQNFGTVYLYSYINETTTLFNKFEYENEKLLEQLNITFYIKELFNITEISKSIDNQESLLIFSYNKNEENFYFYHFDYSNLNDIKLISYGNKYNFWPFRDAIIIKVFFLKNTEYLYYLIKQNNTYNAGVLDIYNNLIIFNLQRDYIEYISFQYNYLIIGYNNSINMICPFESNTATQCSQTLNNKLYIKISEDKKNTKANSCSGYYALNRICLKVIPLGYIENNNALIKCKYFDIDLLECVDSCDDYKIYDSINGICYSCKHFNQYKNSDLNECVSNCSNYGLDFDRVNFTCKNLKYKQNGKYVDKCDPYYVIDEINKLCINCENDTNDTPFYQDNKCVKECDEKYILDNINKYCYNCSEKYGDKYYYFNNTCKLICPEFTLKDEINKICYTCEENNTENIYYENGNCIKECSRGYSTNKYPIKYCLNCHDLNGYEYDGQCIQNCPEYTLYHESPYYCSLCENGTFLDLTSKTCISQCEELSEIDYDKRYCKKCINFNLIFNNYTKKCVKECTNGTSFINGTCEKCDIYDEINKKCLDNCANGKYPFYIENKNSALCFNCFCGFGKCLPKNDFQNKQNNLKIENSYTCQCQDGNDKENLIFGKYCQYKIKIKNNDLFIKPFKESAHINQRNIFTFEFLDDKGEKKEDNSTLRYLSLNHEENYKRRNKYKIKWILNFNKITEEKESFFTIEPGLLKDDYDNRIILTIYDLNDKIIAQNVLFIKIKSIKPDNFDIKLYNNSGFLPMTKNFSPKILINELISQENNNYVLNYMYISKEEEEFSLTGYIRNDYNYKELIIPSSDKIRIEIKNDYNDIIYFENYIEFNTIKSYNKSLSSILENYKIYNYNKGDMKHLLNELKSFFDECQNFDYNEESDNINMILNITEKYLLLSIKYENDIMGNDYFYNYTDNYEDIEPNYFISLLNQISIFLYKLGKEKKNIDNIEEIYIRIINIINKSLNNYESINLLKEETILSIFRTIDNLLIIINKINFIYNDYTELLFNDINLLKNIISTNIIFGKSLKINGKYFNINLLKPSYYSKEISINQDDNSLRYTMEEDNEESEHDFLKYYNYKIEYGKNIDDNFKCNINSIFCINNENYDYLYDEITYLKNEKFTDLIFSITQCMNNNIFISKWNKILNNENNKIFLLNYNDDNSYSNNSFPIQISNYSLMVQIEDPNNKVIFRDLKKFKYNLIFDFPKNYEKDQSNIVCIAMNSLIKENNDIKISEEKNCITYFDTEKNKIICECNTDGEVLILLDKNLADLSKKIQFYNYNIKMINCLSGSIILSTLALITIFSVVLIHCDFTEDKFNKMLSAEKTNFRVKYEYNSFKYLKYSHMHMFAFYLTYYKYYYLNIFSTYRFDHPRYIRFFIEIIKILLNLIFSIYPYYNSPFKEKDDIMNERNINRGRHINNIPSNSLEHFSSFIYSLTASILIWFIAQLFFKMLEFKKFRKYIWKPKKQLLQEYIFNNVKKNTDFKKNFKKVQKAMIAYTKICGKNILSKKSNDKYSLYLKYKSLDNLNLNSKNKLELNMINELNSLPKKDDEVIVNVKKNSLISDSNSNRNSINSLLLNKKPKLEIVSTDKFFILPNKFSTQISMKTIHKLESIKTKYIFTSKKENDDDFSYYDSNVIKYIDLDIESQKNYSYIPSNKLYKNQIISLYNKSKIEMTIIVNILLFILLVLIDIFIIIIFNEIYEKYEDHIITCWLIPVIIQITIFNFIINYLFALLCSFLLFNYYNKRNMNSFLRFIFNLFVEKYMIYFYKIRVLINKYNYQFEHI